jgi:hypothetical protein
MRVSFVHFSPIRRHRRSTPTSSGDQPSGSRPLGFKRWWNAVQAGLLGAGLLAAPMLVSGPVHAAAGVLFGDGLTFPQAGVFLPGALGGHVWLGDAVNGFCRVDPQAGGGVLLTNCRTDGAKSAAQATFDPVRNIVYVADKSTQSKSVAAFAFSPATETLGAVSIIPVVPASGMRPAGVALSSDGNTLYVGMLKANQVWAVNLVTKAASQVAFSADPKVAKGVNSVTMVGGDLYLSEIGGSGVTVIPTIAGIPGVEPPCGANGNFCIAGPTPITSTFPGGIASDGVDVLYVGDSPRITGASVLRYRISTDTQDVYSTNVPPYVFTNPTVIPPTTQTFSTYMDITGLTLTPGGDLYVGADPTFGLPATPVPPTGAGHVWLVPAGSAPDVLGAPGMPALAPAPPATATAQLVAWGVTAPKGGSVAILAEDGKTHIWGSDHAQGVCRFDVVASSTTAPPLEADNPAACDPGTTVGSPGQMAVGPLNADGTRFVFVPDNAVRSPGVWRLTYDPTGNRALDAAGNPIPGTGKGSLSNPVPMAPGKIDNLKPNGVALGPDGKLYVGDLIDGTVRRITNPLGNPRTQQVEAPYETNDLRGINGSMAFVGNDLFLPENNAATYFDITQCPILTATGPVPCQFTADPKFAGPNNIPDNRLPLTVAPLRPVFVSGIATDPTRNLVYISDSPGAAPAVIYRYAVPAAPAATNSGAVATIYVDRGQLPPQVGQNPALPVSATNPAVEFCSITCTRPEDSEPANRLIPFSFAQGLRVNDPSMPDPLGLPPGALYVADDPTAGNRAMHGHLWVVPFTP